MRNIKLSFRDKPGHHHRSISNLHVLLPSHRQTSHHSHRQRLTLTIGMNVSPLLDSVSFSYLLIGNHPHRQLPCRPVTVATSCRSIFYRSLGTCPKTVSTLSNLGKDNLLFHWGSLRNLDTTEDVQPAPINPILPANEIWSAKVTQKCHVPCYYHGPASQGISMSILAQTPHLR